MTANKAIDVLLDAMAMGVAGLLQAIDNGLDGDAEGVTMNGRNNND